MTGVIAHALASAYIPYDYETFKYPYMKKEIQVHNRWMVWIDSRKAILLHADEAGRVIDEEVPSGMGEKVRFHGEGSDKSGAFGYSFDNQSQDQAREREHFHTFLRRVVQHMDHIGSVRILGPGQARFELQHVIEADKSLKDIPVSNEAADQMTLPMLKAAYEVA
jgi:hypothetical protein